MVAIIVYVIRVVVVSVASYKTAKCLRRQESISLWSMGLYLQQQCNK
jgi:hypothetical protein